MRLIFLLFSIISVVSCNQAADGNNANHNDKPDDKNGLEKNIIVFHDHILAVGTSYNLVVSLNPEYLDQITGYGHIVNAFSSDDDAITFDNNSCLVKKGKSDNSCSIEFKINSQAKDIKLSFTVDGIAQTKFATLDTDSSQFLFQTSYKDIYKTGNSDPYKVILKSSGVSSTQIVSLYGYGVNIISPSSKEGNHVCEFNQLKDECPITFQVQDTDPDLFPDSFLGKLIAVPSSGYITQMSVPVCSTNPYMKVIPDRLVVKEQGYPMAVQVYYCDAGKPVANKMIYLHSSTGEEVKTEKLPYCLDLDPPRGSIGSKGICFNNPLVTDNYRIGAFMYFPIRDISGIAEFKYGVKDSEQVEPDFSGSLIIDERIISFFKFWDVQAGRIVGIYSIAVPEDSLVKLYWELDKAGVTDQSYIETTIKIKVGNEYFDVSKDSRYSKFSNILGKYYGIPLPDQLSINTSGIKVDKPVTLKIEFKYQNSDKEIVNNVLTVFVIPKNIE